MMDNKSEKPCLFDHSEKHLLITRMQDDGTRYDYCQGCGWVDIKALIEAEIVEARNDELAFLVRVLDEKKPWDSINPTRLQNYLKDRIKTLNREKEASREK